MADGRGVVEPDYLDVATWRAVNKNNRVLGRIPFTIYTSETWLPRLLVDLDFFPSTSEIKRNRKDLWRDVKEWDHFTLNWADILIIKEGA